MHLRLAHSSFCTLCVILLVLPVVTWANTSVSIHPATTIVDPGETFTVFIYSDDDSVLFNGYETVVRFDSTALAFISATEESVMTSICSNRFWRVTPGSDSIYIGHGLLCPNTNVTGPGPLCSLTFEALTDSRTLISADYFWYTRAGIYIKNVDWHDGLVLVGSPAGDDVRHRSDRGTLYVLPNPGKVFDVYLPKAITSYGSEDIALKVYDISGRTVRDLGDGLLKIEGSRLQWDGTDSLGRPVPSGIYFLVFSGESYEKTEKIILVR